MARKKAKKTTARAAKTVVVKTPEKAPEKKAPNEAQELRARMDEAWDLLEIFTPHNADEIDMKDQLERLLA